MQSSHSRKEPSNGPLSCRSPSSSLTLSKAGLCVLSAQKPQFTVAMQTLWTLAALKGLEPSGRV